LLPLRLDPLRLDPLRLYLPGAMACRSIGDSAARNATADRTEHTVTRRVAGHPTDERAVDAALSLR
jgi:hypothetical protein